MKNKIYALLIPLAFFANSYGKSFRDRFNEELYDAARLKYQISNQESSQINTRELTARIDFDKPNDDTDLNSLKSILDDFSEYFLRNDSKEYNLTTTHRIYNLVAKGIFAAFGAYMMWMEFLEEDRLLYKKDDFEMYLRPGEGVRIDQKGIRGTFFNLEMRSSYPVPFINLLSGKP